MRYHNRITDPEFATKFEEGGFVGHVDLPRLEKGQNGGAFWSVYAPCPANLTDFSDGNYAECKGPRLQSLDFSLAMSPFSMHFLPCL